MNVSKVITKSRCAHEQSEYWIMVVKGKHGGAAGHKCENKDCGLWSLVLRRQSWQILQIPRRKRERDREKKREREGGREGKRKERGQRRERERERERD
jgi:hypothetical protein